MSLPFEIKGKRGVLNLFYEDDELAVDLTEYAKDTTTGYPRSVEMFLTIDQIEELIGELRERRQKLLDRKHKRAHDAAEHLMSSGVSPRDPDTVFPEQLKHNPDIQESVALFYLTEVNDARTPEYPF